MALATLELVLDTESSGPNSSTTEGSVLPCTTAECTIGEAEADVETRVVVGAEEATVVTGAEEAEVVAQKPQKSSGGVAEDAATSEGRPLALLFLSSLDQHVHVTKVLGHISI